MAQATHFCQVWMYLFPVLMQTWQNRDMTPNFADVIHIHWVLVEHYYRHDPSIDFPFSRTCSFLLNFTFGLPYRTQCRPCKQALTFSLVSNAGINRASAGLPTSVVKGQTQQHNTPSLDWFPLARLHQATPEPYFGVPFSLIWIYKDCSLVLQPGFHHSTLIEIK